MPGVSAASIALNAWGASVHVLRGREVPASTRRASKPRNHRHRPCPAGAIDVRHRRPATLSHRKRRQRERRTRSRCPLVLTTASRTNSIVTRPRQNLRAPAHRPERALRGRHRGRPHRDDSQTLELLPNPPVATGYRAARTRRRHAPIRLPRRRPLRKPGRLTPRSQPGPASTERCSTAASQAAASWAEAAAVAGAAGAIAADDNWAPGSNRTAGLMLNV